MKKTMFFSWWYLKIRIRHDNRMPKIDRIILLIPQIIVILSNSTHRV